VLKMRMIAKIDGDQIIAALRMSELSKAELGMCFEIAYQGGKIECDTVKDVISVARLLAQASSEPTEEKP